MFPRVIRWVWDNTDYRAQWRAESAPEPSSFRPLVAPLRVHLSFFSELGVHRTLP